MIKPAILVAVCLVGSMAMVLDKPYYDPENAEDLFRNFVKEHGKSYTTKEYLERLQIFKGSLKNINHLNNKHPQTVFAVNRFADWKSEEVDQLLGFKPLNETRVKVTIPDSGVVPPASLDWRHKHVVSYVKDQGSCGSGYIFSAIANIEGQHAIQHQQCLALSEGQALDCLECGSCGGGIIHEVMQEFAQKAGVMEEKSYRYKPRRQKCHERVNKVKVHVLGGQEIEIPDEVALTRKLLVLGPLAVGMTVDKDTFVPYHGGILPPSPTCTDKVINHGVLLVGYGQENGTDYWIIKNSWGEKWGEKGYLRLIRGIDACHMGTGYTASASVV